MENDAEVISQLLNDCIKSKTDWSNVTSVNHKARNDGQTTSRDLCQHTLCTLVW